MQAIVNARLVGRDAIVEDATIVVDGERIADCGSAARVTPPPGSRLVDAGGRHVVPGFIDVHCHGGAGCYVHEDPRRVADLHLRHGTTGLLATLVLLERDEIIPGIERVMQAAHPAVIGLHMEGPYLSKKYGAKREMSRLPDPAEYQSIIRTAGDQLKIWTFAPELPGADAFVDAAAAAGIILSVGHSEADARRIFELADRGLRLGCHCMCATGVMPSPMGGVREVGVDEAVMVHDGLFAEVIPDSLGVHVRPLMLRLLLKAKGIDKTIIITDAVKQAGENCARRRLRAQDIDREQAPWRALSCLPEPRFINAENRDYLEIADDINISPLGRISGSKLTMDQAVRNMMRHTGVDLAAACRMAALNPAILLGIESEVGSLEPGKRANLALVSADMDVERVMLNGAWVG